MPIKFHCPNTACGRALTVGDDAAGRKGKCPGCGGILVVPKPEPTAAEVFDEFEVEPEPEPVPVPKARAQASRPPVTAWPPGRAPVAAGVEDDPEWSAGGSKGAGGAVVSFEAIGLGWELLKQRLGTWVLAMLVIGMALFGSQVLLNFATIFSVAIESSVIGSPVPITPFAVIVLSVMLQTVLLGGLYRLALKQIDGGDIQVGDVLSVGGAAPSLALAGVLTSVAMFAGFVVLVIPGLIAAGLFMFTLPAVVDGHGAMDAIRQSVGTLKRQWGRATLFMLVSWMILALGALFCGIGMLFTMPLFVLACTVQYRRSFAPGGVPRKTVVADPWAEAAGQPSSATGSGRVPIWAFGVLGLCLLAPFVLAGGLVGLLIPAVREARRQAVARQEMLAERDRLEAGHLDPRGFPGKLPAPPPQVNRQPPPRPVVRQASVDDALNLLKRGGNERGNALGILGGLPVGDEHRKEVTAALAPLLRDPEFDYTAANLFERWAGPDDVPALVAGLDSDKLPVRLILIRTLGRLKAEQTIPVLVEHISVPQERSEVFNALQSIGPASVPELRKLLASGNADTRRSASNLLRRFGVNDGVSKVTGALAALKTSDPVEQSQALMDLSMTPPVETSREEVLAAVLPLMRDSEPRTRLKAVKVLERWGTADQLPALIEATEDSDRGIQVVAISALRKHPDPQAALALVRLLENPEVRREASSALTAMKIKDSQVEAEVLKRLASSDDATRVAACQVLRAIGTEASVPTLERATLDSQRSVASAARSALFAIQGPSGTQPRMTPRKSPFRKR